MPDLSATRYARQSILPDFGPTAQAKLASAHALIVGVGALGSASADHLARAGIGNLTLIDRDVVEWSNLQRQTLYDESDARQGIPKAEAAANRLTRVNSSIIITPRVADVTHRSIESIFNCSPISPTAIVDGSDSVETRFLLNDFAIAHSLPLVYGGVVGSRGMQATFLAGIYNNSTTNNLTATQHTFPCLRCLFPDAPAPGAMPTCDTAGVLGPVVAIVAAAQAADVIKLAMGRHDLLSQSLLEFDLWLNTRRRIDLRAARDPNCICCVQKKFNSLRPHQNSSNHSDSSEGLDNSPEETGAQLCGQDAVQILPSSHFLPNPNSNPNPSIDLAALAIRWQGLGPLVKTSFMLRLTLAEPPIDISVFPDGRAIIKGTRRLDLARSIYARFVGV